MESEEAVSPPESHAPPLKLAVAQVERTGNRHIHAWMPAEKDGEWKAVCGITRTTEQLDEHTYMQRVCSHCARKIPSKSY